MEINLHDYTIEELRALRSKAKNTFARGILTAVILRCEGKDNTYIISDV